MWVAVRVRLDDISIDVRALRPRPLSILWRALPWLTVVLTLWRGRDVERYTGTHNTNVLMKAINSKQKRPDEFWESLRDEFMKGPPIFVR